MGSKQAISLARLSRESFNARQKIYSVLAVEIAVGMTIRYQQELKLNPNAVNWSPWIGAFFFVVALIFVYRSFYGMRIPEDK